MSKYVEYIGYFFLFLIPFFESSEKGWGFAFLLLGSFLISLDLIKKRISFDILDILFFLFLIVALISSIYSLSPSRSFAELLRYSAYLLIFIRVRRYDVTRKSFLKKAILLSLISYSLIYGLLTIYYTFHTTQNVGVDILNFYIPLAGHNHISGLLLLAIPLTISLFMQLLKSQKKLPVFLAGLTVVFQFLVLILSFSRSAYLLILFYFCALIFARKSIMKTKFIYLLSFCVLMVFLVFQFVFFYGFSKSNYLGVNGRFYKSIYYPEIRIEYLKQALKGFKTSPILGTGLDTFIYVSRKFKSTDGPFYTSSNVHNYFIQMVTETGLLGGSLYSLFFIAVLIKAFRMIKKEDNFLNLSIFLCVILTLLNNMVDYQTQFLSILLLVFIFLALLNPASTINGDKKNDRWNIPLILFLIVYGYGAFSFTLGALVISKFANIKLTDSANQYDLTHYVLPWNSAYLDRLSLLYEFNRRYDKAQYYNRLARNFDSYDLNINMHGASIEERLGNYPKAQAIYFRIISNEPTNSLPYKFLFSNYYYGALDNIQKEDYKNAVKYMQQAEQMFPQSARVSAILEKSISANSVSSDFELISAKIIFNVDQVIHKDVTTEELNRIRSQMNFVDNINFIK